MKGPVQICLSGGRGQGLITAAVILAEAALLDGKNVLQTQGYGSDAEWGASEDVELGATESEVILSRKQITYPRVTKPDVLLCLSQDAFERYCPQVNSDTLVVLDSTNVACKAPAGQVTYRFPITETAVRVGNRVVANVVALGVLNELLNLVAPASLQKAVSTRVPQRFRTLSEQALVAGAELLEVHEPD